MYQVTKRNGKKEELDAEKINKVLIWATEGISGVSASDIAMNAKLQFYSGMKTEEIHDILIQSAVDLISEKTPNYQYVAGNLLNYLLRKQVFEYKNGEMPHLWTVTSQNVKRGVYDHIVLDKYNTEELSVLNLYIKHKRDYDFTYAGIQQLIDKYLVKDRSTGKTFETPQYAYMLIAMTVFMDWKNPDERLHHVKKLYDLMSLQKISLPTPILAGIRTTNRQYSSCTLIEVGDSLDSIFASNTAIGQYVAKRAGIGLNAGALRAKGSKIRNGEVVHTGVVPFFKMFQSVMGSCSAGGIRKGSATLYFPWWHKEIEDVLVLKNNKGTDDNRVRHIDYGIQFSKLFYKRFVDNLEVSLFSPGDAPGLYDAFGDNEKFDELYLRYEKDKKVPKKVVKARDLMNQFAQERLATGRMYVMNIDHANTNTPWKGMVRQSNLCLSGDSMINSVIIDNKLIKSLKLIELVKLFNTAKDIKILSKNLETDTLEFKTVEKAWKTKENAEIFEISDDETGLNIKCTGDHLIYTKNRGWVEAQYLIETDQLDYLKDK